MSWLNSIVSGAGAIIGWEAARWVLRRRSAGGED